MSSNCLSFTQTNGHKKSPSPISTTQVSSPGISPTWPRCSEFNGFGPYNLRSQGWEKWMYRQSMECWPEKHWVDPICSPIYPANPDVTWNLGIRGSTSWFTYMIPWYSSNACIQVTDNCIFSFPKNLDASTKDATETWLGRVGRNKEGATGTKGSASLVILDDAKMRFSGRFIEHQVGNMVLSVHQASLVKLKTCFIRQRWGIPIPRRCMWKHANANAFYTYLVNCGDPKNHHHFYMFVHSWGTCSKKEIRPPRSWQFRWTRSTSTISMEAPLEERGTRHGSSVVLSLGLGTSCESWMMQCIRLKMPTFEKFRFHGCIYWSED